MMKGIEKLRKYLFFASGDGKVWKEDMMTSIDDHFDFFEEALQLKSETYENVLEQIDDKGCQMNAEIIFSHPRLYPFGRPYRNTKDSPEDMARFTHLQFQQLHYPPRVGSKLFNFELKSCYFGLSSISYPHITRSMKRQDAFRAHSIQIQVALEGKYTVRHLWIQDAEVEEMMKFKFIRIGSDGEDEEVIIEKAKLKHRKTYKTHRLPMEKVFGYESMVVSSKSGDLFRISEVGQVSLRKNDTLEF